MGGSSWIYRRRRYGFDLSCDVADVSQVELQVLDFSRPERLIYKNLEDRAKRRFIQMDAEGRAMSNYTSILAMLMK